MRRQGSPNPTFWNKKRVLLTGHTGFKGAWLAIWLHKLGAEVTGVSLEPATDPNLFDAARVGQLASTRIADIRDRQALTDIVRDANPEIVLHLAAQALVRKGFEEPVDTFSTNVQGTVNVMDAVGKHASAAVFIAITTDKVYKNLEHHFPYRETDALGGHDPYSASKAASEIAISCYRDSYFRNAGIALASARAGNVIGGGDWSDDRLIPDAIRAWQKNEILEIRRPSAIRPWQHVLEPLAGYMNLVEALWNDSEIAGAYNFGPATNSAATVKEVIGIAAKSYGGGKVEWGDGTEGPHEAELLSLEIAKAHKMIGYTPLWGLEESIDITVSWYRNYLQGMDALECCSADIERFETPSAGN